MEFMTALMALALAGGLVVASLLVLAHHRLSRNSERLAARGNALRFIDGINMAHIPVAGIGGLGIVAMALIVAANIPSIGVSLAVGLVLGAAFAVGLIARRKRSAALPSIGGRPGATTTANMEHATLNASADDPARPDRTSLAIAHTTPA